MIGDIEDTVEPFFESYDYLVRRMLFCVGFSRFAILRIEGCLNIKDNEGCLNSTLQLYSWNPLNDRTPGADAVRVRSIDGVMSSWMGPWDLFSSLPFWALNVAVTALSSGQSGLTKSQILQILFAGDLWPTQLVMHQDRGFGRWSTTQWFGRGDDAVGNPHRTQNIRFELFEFILLLKLDTTLYRTIPANRISINSILPLS